MPPAFRNTLEITNALDVLCFVSYIICVHTFVHTKGDIQMTTTRIFQNGNSQALRIPREMRADKKEYCINKIGDIYIAFPSDDPWAPVREVIGTFPDDFMESRDQPSLDDIPARETF